MNSRKRSHSGDGARPAPIPVLRITSREKRSGCSTASRSPSGPPQSWTTTVASRRSSSSSEPLDRPVVAVVGVASIGRLVRAAEAEVVGRDRARRPGERRDQLAVEERPGRLAVQQQHRVARALVEVVHPQAVLLDVVRLEGVARKPAKRSSGVRKTSTRPA